MRALVIVAPHRAEVHDVPAPVAGPAQVVVDVERVGLCGTDVEFFTGEMSYLHSGDAAYPMRIGHEWCGAVSAVGDGVDPSWLGVRVTGDTMLGCGHCHRCRAGRHHVCADRFEIGVRGGFPGAVAEQLVVPLTALYRLPDSVDAVLGALVEPGGNALRAVRAAGLAPGARVLVLGPGTIGLLVARFAQVQQAEVHLMGRADGDLGFASGMGLAGVWTLDTLPDLPFDAIVDATNAATLPAFAAEKVEPGKRVVYVGLAGSPSMVDTRTLVLKDVTAVGILSASAGLAGTIDAYSTGAVDPRDLVAATVPLDDVGTVLSGGRPAGAGPGPKIHVDPHIRTGG